VAEENILHVSWRDKITNKSIKERTDMERRIWRASSGRED